MSALRIRIQVKVILAVMKYLKQLQWNPVNTTTNGP